MVRNAPAADWIALGVLVGLALVLGLLLSSSQLPLLLMD